MCLPCGRRLLKIGAALARRACNVSTGALQYAYGFGEFAYFL